jgi:hypothetical protein
VWRKWKLRKKEQNLVSLAGVFLWLWPDFETLPGLFNKDTNFETLLVQKEECIKATCFW